MSKRMSAPGRRAAVVAATGLACGLLVGIVSWVTTQNMGLSFAAGGALALVFSGSGAAAGRSRR